MVIPFDPLPHQGRGRWLWRLRNLHGGNFYAALGPELAEIQLVLKLLRPQVMLCHFGTVALRALPAAEARGIPLVVHFHGIDITGSLRDRWYRWSLRRCLPRFAAMVVVADYQREILRSLGADPAKIHHIPCGVPIAPVAAGAVVGATRCRFLAVGRLVAKKGPLATLRAFARCHARVPGCQLTLIGDGPLAGAARRLCADLGLGEHVRFLGSQPREVVAAELAAASVFVQHSVTAASGDREGWPVSIAEAMAAGLPVVATRHAGILEQVAEGQSGFLVDEHAWESMGDHMAILASDPALRTRMGAHARAIAVKSFDQRSMVARLEAVLIAVARPANVPTRNEPILQPTVKIL
jgi:glycosyltransferase involved in cell wall biosynthesis